MDATKYEVVEGVRVPLGAVSGEEGTKQLTRC